MKSGNKLLPSLLFALFIGIAIGCAGTNVWFINQPQINAENIPVRIGEKKLINPLLFCNVDSPKDLDKFTPLENALKIGTFDLLNDPSVITESVYFQDLLTGHWVGINENIAYDPASLLKVPLMIAYFKEAETSPTILQKQVIYQGRPGNSPGSAFYSLIPGKSYSIEELIEAMIVESDNGAKDLLGENIDQNVLIEIYKDLGISISDNGKTFQISASVYSEFFRILYNSTYLNEQYSEKALELLSKTSFDDGLMAGVPSGTIVAHKFGTFANLNAVGNRIGPGELHDCGIVYHKIHPYLICIMTRGNKISVLTKLITTISKIVYQKVNSGYAIKD